MIYEKISAFSDEIAKCIDTQFEVLNKLNIKYFEVRGVDGKNISTLNDEEIQILKSKMERYGIKVSSVASPIGKIKIEDDFTLHFEVFKKIVEIAKTLGTKYVRIFSFYHEGGDEWTTSEREKVFVYLRQMIAYAKEQDVILLHENEKDIYGDTVDRCIDLMKELHCDNFKAVFDPANFVQCGQDTKYAFDNLKEYVEYMHIKDARLTDDEVVPAGMGDGNIAYILAALFDSGYQGYLSLEPHLGSFEGIESLELDKKMSELPKGGEGTFTLAYHALCEVLEEIL